MEAVLGWGAAVGSASLCGLGCAGGVRRNMAAKKIREHLPRHVVVCLLLTPCPHRTQMTT